MREITKETEERAAKALAEAINGGNWDTDYSLAQKELWRSRVRAAMRVEA
jgi:hypothetical protein